MPQNTDVTSFEEVKKIREDILETFKRNLDATPILIAEIHDEKPYFYTSEYFQRPNQILTMTIIVDITDKEFTLKLEEGE